jgi:hypothetical protein
MNRQYLDVRRRKLLRTDSNLGRCLPTDPTKREKSLLQKEDGELVCLLWSPWHNFWVDNGWQHHMSPTEAYAAGWRYLRAARPWEAVPFYEDNHSPEINCEQCGRLFRGPTIYCSLECASLGTPPRSAAR